MGWEDGVTWEAETCSPDREDQNQYALISQLSRWGWKMGLAKNLQIVEGIDGCVAIGKGRGGADEGVPGNKLKRPSFPIMLIFEPARLDAYIKSRYLTAQGPAMTSFVYGWR